MLEAIKNFTAQFKYQPKIINKNKYKAAKKFIVLGMGGSHLAADVLAGAQPQLKIVIHKNYGLPNLDDKELKESMIIASSYSGNTEEVIDGFKKALAKKLNVVAIATGGKLITLAKKYKRPYIELPKTGIQPRSALGFSLRGLLKIMGQNKILKETEIVSQLKATNYQGRGQKLAKLLKNHVPIIYVSDSNEALAYNWKIKFNETGKIPAFYNTVPELNHNEMTGFDVVAKNRQLSNKFSFIFLSDREDHPQNIKRLQVLAKLYKKRNLPITSIVLNGQNKWLKIFGNLLIADWAAYYTALGYGRDPEPVPMVEEFKKMI